MNCEKLLQYIENNLTEDITLENIARLGNYSTRQLYDIIKIRTGMPIMTYVRFRRIKAAMKEISDGRSLYDVALEYGFDTQAGFYKAFLKQVGCSPSNYSSHEYRHDIRINLPRIKTLSEDDTIMNDIIIREVNQADVKSMWENIYSRNTPIEVEQRIAESINEAGVGNRIQLVAVIDNNVIGTIQLIKEQHILYSHRCKLADMIVNPAFSHQGLATRLFHEVCKCAEKLNISYIITSCRGDGTENFYKAIGMQEYGRIPDGIYEPWGEKKKYDEILFCKNLICKDE